jgi:RNase adapter protein RapZ
MNSQDLQFVIITGMSGAGKSQAMNSLEDQGYFCVDNLPPTFIEKFAELCAQSQGAINKIALVCDLRGGEFFAPLSQILQQLRRQGLKYQMLFLEASDETLVRRYKESRRRHPLSPDGILEGISSERAQLAELRGKADKVIDTSNLSAQQLRESVAEIFGHRKDNDRIRISMLSFGFKYGIPMDADLVMDVRFLPNPFYIEHLRPLTGEELEVKEYVLDAPLTKAFLVRYTDLLKYILPHYIKEGKTNLVIAIGCTGGQHRSVAIACEIGRLLKREDYQINIKHRDAQRNKGGIRP